MVPLPLIHVEPFDRQTVSLVDLIGTVEAIAYHMPEQRSRHVLFDADRLQATQQSTMA